MLQNKKYLYYIGGSILLFILISFLYASPVLSGKQLFQHDIVQYKGGAKELLDYRAQYGRETYWSDSMFGGMPTYQMGAQFRGDVITRVDDLLNIFPKPVNYLVTLFGGFFLLGLVAVRNWKYALLGALFFGLSTYFYIIIAAGHNGKVHTIAYFAPLLAGILLVYIRKKYVAGFIVTTLFMGLQMAANHPQMTYYFFMALAFFFISELVRAVKGKTDMRHFLMSTAIVGVAMLLGIGMNAQRLMANSEYVKETVRGKQILTNESHRGDKSGMDKESILNWSYGKLETLNLFIPRLMGGSSQEEGSDVMMSRIQELVQENATSQNEVDNIVKGLASPTYWGEQPGTSGPAYQGAVVIFLAILGFFLAPKKYRYWILASSVLTIALAWGSNLMPLSDFFIDFVPFYNKFRAPSSILVVVELLFPLIAVIGLYQFFNVKKHQDETDTGNAERQKKLLYVTAGLIGFTLLLVLLAKPLLGFYSDNEKTYLPPYLLDYLVSERSRMFRIDAVKAIIYVAITAAAMFFAVKGKITRNVALLIIGAVSFFDLWTVNKRYLNNDNFIDRTFAENPFQTESSDLLISKVGDNANLQSLLANANVNKTLETIAAKDQSHYRIFNQLLGPFNETNTSYFKSSVGGYHAVKLRRYDDLINHYFYASDSTVQKQIPQILNLLNAKYVVGGSPDQPQVQMNPEANGNAWFVSEVKFARNPNEEIGLVGAVNTKTTAVIGADQKKYFNGKRLAPDPTAALRLTSYKADELTFSTRSHTPQLAVFSEVYYPNGWQVLLDGKKVDYVRADYLLRGLYIPAGQHEVKMIFAPEVLKTGRTISMVALALFILLSAAGLWYASRHRNRLEIHQKPVA